MLHHYTTTISKYKIIFGLSFYNQTLNCLNWENLTYNIFFNSFYKLPILVKSLKQTIYKY